MQQLSLPTPLSVTITISFVLMWVFSVRGDDGDNKPTGPQPKTGAASEADAPKSESPEVPFAHKVREDIFAGFGGDEEAMQRGLKTCDEALAANPKHAEALAWRGSARLFLSGKAFRENDVVKGGTYWESAIKDLDKAGELEPDNIGVLIPRAASMLAAGRNAPPAMGQPLLKKVKADFERTYNRQKDYLDKIGEHPLGELRMGLADVYRLLGETEKSKAQLVAIQNELPKSEYAKRATEWLAAPADKKLAHRCIGCHGE